MFRKIALASLATVGFTLIAAMPAQAAPPCHEYQVQYRLLSWHERAFYSPWLAREYADLKRREGFETYLVAYGWEFHVRYRMPFWRTYRTVESHSYAHELADILLGRGYQARVLHY